MIKRLEKFREVRRVLSEMPICSLLGPRQCGKTTLARQLAGRKINVHYFDLERASDRARLQNPELILSDLQGLVILDEIQRIPDLFTVLRPLADRPGRKARFLILGSASPGLVQGVSESLAGRVGFVDLGGFSLEEVGRDKWKILWLRGGFPRSFLATSDTASKRWKRNFIRTFLERDLPQLGITIPSESLRRFWMMLAQYHAQLWNAADLSRSLGISENTARHYLDLLTGAYIIRQLQPWWENIGKRQYKSPKVYFRDSGLVHRLLDIDTFDTLLGNPKFGASWEGFALEQVLEVTGAEQTYFWGTHAGAELDLLLLRGGKRYGVEFKCNEAPAMTKSMHVALQDLKLEKIWIVYPGKHSFPIHGRVEALPIHEVPSKLRRFK